MTAAHDDTEEKVEALGEFLEELPLSADPESVVRRFAAAYPQWAKDFLEEAVLSRMLVTARDDDTFPDLSELTDFKILRGIAVGGMGVVYEAEQLSLNRRVALKVRYGQPSPEREAGFDREQRVLARLHQSHIVPIYQSGRCGIWQYFAMAYIEGVTLHQLLRTVWERATGNRAIPDLRTLVIEAKRRDLQIDESTRLSEFAEDLAYRSTHRAVPATPEPVAARQMQPLRLPPSYFRAMAALLADAAEAIAHAHAADVLHRDIKPSNIMVDAAGQCWLIDFGLAAVAKPSAEGEPTPSGAAGTPGYIAPEQLLPGAGAPGERSDVWGLGVTLYEAVTLRRPAVTQAEAEQSIRSLVPNVPADLAAICQRATEREPERRYGTAGELAADLRRWLDGRPTLARPVGPSRAAMLWSRRNKGWAAALASALLLLVACGVFLVVRADHRAEQAELNSRAAEARADDEREKGRLLERDGLLHDVQRLQMAEADNGWSDKAWDSLVRANGVRSDDRIRDLAAGTLGGWDARIVKHFAFPSSSIAFAPDGRSLLIGGLVGKEARPPSTWMAGTDRLAELPQSGEGPVAYGAGGVAYQLKTDGGELILADLAGNQAAWRVPMPDEKRVRDSLKTTLSIGADWIAVSAEIEKGKPITRLWQVSSVAPYLQFGFASDAVAFSGSGELVAIADNEHRRIAIHSLKSKALVVELPTGAVPIHSLAFGKNPRRSGDPLARHLLAAGDAGGSAIIWDLRSRMPLSHCRGLPRDVTSLAFHPDGILLATGGREEIQIWEVTSGRACLRLRPRLGIDYITGLTFSPDGTRLAASSLGIYCPPCTVLWEFANGRGVSRLMGLSGQIDAIAISPDGKSAAALAQNWELGVWDLESGRLNFTLEVPPGEYADNAGLTFGPDGRTLAYSVGAAREGTALLIDAVNGDELKRWKLPAGLQNRFGFDGAGRLWHFQFELESREGLPTTEWLPWQKYPRVGSIRNLFGADPTKPLVELRDFPRQVLRAEITPDGKYTILEGGGTVSRLQVIENATGNIAANHPAPADVKSSGLIVDSSGAWAQYSARDNARVRRFTIPDGPLLATSDLPAMAVNATAGYACWRTHGTAFGCFLVRSGRDEPLVNFAAGIRINVSAFDTKGRRLIWGGRDGSVMAADLAEVRKRLEPLGLAW